MAGKEKTEGARILDSFSKALVLAMGLVLAGLFFGIRNAFGDVISIMGFALFFLLFYSVR
ncbi:MAG: hypothetical protein PHH08_00550 [Candidatus ainarchaeum sp.]|nr:hypothetical protein [Candidatus ainarchaeum sp.]